MTENPQQPQEETYPLFGDPDAPVKEEEIDEDGGQYSGAMEGLIKEEFADDDEFRASGAYEEELGEGLKEEANQASSSLLLQNHAVVGTSAMNSCSFSFLPQEPGALNAADLLQETAPGGSSEDPNRDYVVKKEEPDEEEEYPMFMQVSSSLPQNHSVVGASVVNSSNFSVLTKDPRPLNVAGLLLETTPGGSSENPCLDSVGKKEEPEENEEYPSFMQNPPPQKETLFRDAGAPVKDEIDEDGGQYSGAMESLIKEEYVDGDEFGASGAYEEELGEGLEEEVNQASSSLLQNHSVFRASAVNSSNSFLLSQEPGALNAAGGSSEDPSLDSVGKKEEPEEEDSCMQDASTDFVTAFVNKGDFYQCKICDAHVNNALLVYHCQTHRLCKKCGMRFRSKEALIEHKRVHNECNICGKTFYNFSYLKIHMRSHTGERPYECEICQKTFIQKCDLTVHMQMHEREKLFGKKEASEKRFKTKKYLTVHLRTHTGERPYECPDCQKRFKHPSTCKRHRDRFHGLQNTSS